uniref:Uncharacterized protein n=1 Tax=Amphora coffeiformis TaxID=265554 RepID=A0A7S3LEC8_9STRA
MEYSCEQLDLNCRNSCGCTYFSGICQTNCNALHNQCISRCNQEKEKCVEKVQQGRPRPTDGFYEYVPDTKCARPWDELSPIYRSIMPTTTNDDREEWDADCTFL